MLFASLTKAPFWTTVSSHDRESSCINSSRVLSVNSQHLNCETKTSLFSHILPMCSSFCQFFCCLYPLRNPSETLQKVRGFCSRNESLESGGPNAHLISSLHKLFENFAETPHLCDMNQEPSRNCSEKLPQMSFFLFDIGWIWGGYASLFTVKRRNVLKHTEAS